MTVIIKWLVIKGHRSWLGATNACRAGGLSDGFASDLAALGNVEATRHNRFRTATRPVWL